MRLQNRIMKLTLPSLGLCLVSKYPEKENGIILRENEVSAIILDTCIRLHTQYGPGLYESVYEEVLSYELNKRNLYLERQKGIPFVHESVRLDAGFRADLIVEKLVLIEIKSVQALLDVHYKQVQTYLKLTGLKLGLLLNFNVKDMKTGINRIIM